MDRTGKTSLTYYDPDTGPVVDRSLAEDGVETLTVSMKKWVFRDPPSVGDSGGFVFEVSEEDLKNKGDCYIGDVHSSDLEGIGIDEDDAVVSTSEWASANSANLRHICELHNVWVDEQRKEVDDDER